MVGARTSSSLTSDCAERICAAGWFHYWAWRLAADSPRSVRLMPIAGADFRFDDVHLSSPYWVFQKCRIAVHVLRALVSFRSYSNLFKRKLPFPLITIDYLPRAGLIIGHAPWATNGVNRNRPPTEVLSQKEVFSLLSSNPKKLNTKCFYFARASWALISWKLWIDADIVRLIALLSIPSAVSITTWAHKSADTFRQVIAFDPPT